MTTHTKAATPAPKAKTSQTVELSEVTITPQQLGGKVRPCLELKGEAPAKGARVRFTAGNGVTYTGTVADTVEAGGDVFIELKDGLKPEPAKKT